METNRDIVEKMSQDTGFQAHPTFDTSSVKSMTDTSNKVNVGLSGGRLVERTTAEF